MRSRSILPTLRFGALFGGTDSNTTDLARCCRLGSSQQKRASGLGKRYGSWLNRDTRLNLRLTNDSAMWIESNGSPACCPVLRIAGGFRWMKKNPTSEIRLGYSGRFYCFGTDCRPILCGFERLGWPRYPVKSKEETLQALTRTSYGSRG